MNYLQEKHWLSDDDFVNLIINNAQISIELKDVLLDLCFIIEEKSNLVTDKLINLIGNNHQGIYYPNIIPVLDFLILLFNHSQNNRVRYTCILSIFNDLYYFMPDVNGDDFISFRELQSIVTNKLKKYSDENFDDLLKLSET